jgi:Arylsulfatase regulator (Fe-S oxidoreductase)
LTTPAQQQFGLDKYARLPMACKQCEVLRACWGGCPKHRFMPGDDGEMNYLCEGFRHYFRHLPPYLNAMRDLLASGRPASDIMKAHLIFPQNKKSPPEFGGPAQALQLNLHFRRVLLQNFHVGMGFCLQRHAHRDVAHANGI